MKKKIYLALAAVPMFMSTLVGCSALHVHTIDSPYEHDETSHWKTCKVCHQKFDQHEHTWNEFNDTCFICEYQDPLVVLEGNVVVGLTPHGRDKLTFDMPDEVNDVPVEGIAPGAFLGSRAVTVKLNKNLKYYYKEAFTGTNVRIITSEEGDTIQWEYDPVDKRMEKHSNYVAMIGNQYYETLHDAFASVRANDTTITLLKDDIKLESFDRLPVNFSITLVSYYSSAFLSCNFDISASGILYIPETITYKGTTRLMLSCIMEKRGDGDSAKNGNHEDEVYNSGSLVFTNRETRPDDITVGYVRTFHDAAPLIPAQGAKQVVNAAIVTLPINHYAFGTLRFNQALDAIKGLTEYGQTVNGLTITSPFEGEKFEIGDNAFNIAWDLKVPVGATDILKDVHYYNFLPKGMFFDLTIGEGITKIRDRAFNNRIDGDIDHDVAEQLNLVFSHLLTVTLGDDVKEIGYRAFYDNVSLKSVSGGKNLEKIGESAFEGDAELVIADFTYSKLAYIVANAFSGCSSLSRLGLPAGVWHNGPASTYFPYDMTPERLAFAVSHTKDDKTWVREGEELPSNFAYTATTHKDSLGRFDQVGYAATFELAVEKCADNGEIYVTQKSGMEKLNIKRIGPKGEDGAYGKSFALTVDPAINNFTITSDKADKKLSISENYWFAVTNAKVDAKIEIEGNVAGGYNFNDVGTFAIRQEYGVNPDDYNVTISCDDKVECTAKHNEFTFAQKNYDGFGLFNFTIDNNNVTHIKGGSKLGEQAKAITFGRTCEQSSEVKLDGTMTIAAASNLESAVITDEVTSIGKFFTYPNNDTKGVLKEVVLGRGITKIEDEAFKYRDGLISITLPDTITSIGADAFHMCGFSNIDIPASVTSIGDSAFNDCFALKSVSIPADSELKTIGSNAFTYCKNLRDISFGNKLTTIGYQAFSDDDNLTEIKLPSTIETISDRAFSFCDSLKSVYLPDDNALKYIGQYAFLDCYSLTSFRFGDNVNNWKAGSTDIEATDIADTAKAAEYLRDTYKDKVWQRSA
ncbi:MAG: leucine-rich repeat domain-containing protein [Bacilli bacterium]|nr:leucine-rich repeat domain-containing protein [Bacilli bacterium]